MNIDTHEITIPIKHGWEIGRNGLYYLSAINLFQGTDGVTLNGVSKKHHILIHGGINMTPEDMDTLARKWLLHRGLIGEESYEDKLYHQDYK